MASEQDVQRVIADLLQRIGDVDESRRAMLPRHRLIEIRCPDLELTQYAEWRSGEVRMLEHQPEQRPQIRIAVGSDELVRIATGEVSFARAYASRQLRIDASMSDLLRLRAAL